MFRFRLKIAVFLIGLTVFPIPSRAQEYEQNRSGTAPGWLERTDFEAFVDGLMAVEMRERHIAGAVFTAVGEGRILLSKGYGYADRERGFPVAASRTLFRPGSVSKLITWTAVMQLVEQGRIALDADVNDYTRDLKIPDRFGQPVTMSHLMSHTAGFEDKAAGLMARSERDLAPLGRFLREVAPTRVRPPGELASYSNYGTALAGYIVEAVSGTPFEDYVEWNIFRPLEMHRSTFRQPLPDALRDDMSIGYVYRDGEYIAREFELIKGLTPSGAMSATADDMARFMIAHLQLGELNGARILRPETARRMHSRLFSHDERLDGNAHGFWESTVNGIRCLSHGGDTRFFHSVLFLVPEKSFGFFLSFNSEGGGGGARTLIIHAVMDRLFPSSGTRSGDIAGRPAAPGRVTGSYVRTRGNSSSFEKIGALMSGITVKSAGKGRLLINAGGEPSLWEPAGDNLFRRKGGEDTVLFREDASGRVTHLFLGGSPQIAGIRLSWPHTPGFHYSLFGVISFLFLSTLIWPIDALRRRICRPGDREDGAPRGARAAALVACGLGLAFFLGGGLFFLNPGRLSFGIPLAFKILLALPLVAVPVSLAVLFFAGAAWIRRWWTWCDRVHYTLVLGGLAGFFWFLNFWNLLGYRF